MNKAKANGHTDKRAKVHTAHCGICIKRLKEAGIKVEHWTHDYLTIQGCVTRANQAP